VSHLLSNGLLSKTSPSQILQAIGLGLETDKDSQALPSNGQLFEALAGGVTLDDFDAVAYTNYVKSSRLIARELHVAPGEQALIVNGRVSVSYLISFSFLKILTGGWSFPNWRLCVFGF
jgi:UDP-glucose:glycoprotein glucosyltransferase